MRRRAAVATAVLLLVTGCSTSATPPSTPTPTAPTPTAPTPTAPTPTVVTDPLATAEPDSAGVVVLRSRAVLDDGPGDVWQLTPRLVRVRQSGIDVRRTEVEVAQSEVRVTSRFVDLRSVDRATYDVGLRTPRGLYYLDVVSGPNDLADRSSRLVDPSGDEVRCRGVRHDADATSDTVTVDVPLRCLGEPPWVAVRLLVSLRDGGRTYEENPHNHRPFSEFFTERLYPPS